MLVYCVFYVVTNREYFLSQEFKTKLDEIASKNEVLNNAYNYIMKYVGKYFVGAESENAEQDENSGQTENAEGVQQPENEQTTQVDQTNNSMQDVEGNNIQAVDQNIGGSRENIEQMSEKTQEEQDVEYIKNNINFILPIQGTITSTFGWRTPTTPTVPKYHTGLDIAAAKGTVIKAATDGTITLVSTEGDYGNHYQVQIGEIIIIYAHCDKLYLKEGDVITQGQEIAEVGATGNTTRTSFAF